MRIGLVTGEFPPMEGGVGAFTNELAKALAQGGHEVHVLTSRLARPAEQPRKISLLSQPIDLEYASLLPTVRHWRWSTNRHIVDWAIRFDLDVVNIQYQAAAYNMFLPGINFAPRRLRNVVKTAVTFHDLRHPYFFPKAGKLRRKVVHWMAQQANGVLATNPADYQKVKELGCQKAIEIPIGSNISVYEPNHLEIEEARTELGVPASAVLLGYFGFLNETKGAETLLSAIARLDDNHHVVFIGGQLGASDATNNATYLNQLRQMIKSLGIEDRVHWTGYLSENRVSTFMYATDMMVMPYRDGASLRRGTLMAALAHGRPLISTWPIGATPFLEHGENIWFVPIDDPEAIVTAVASIKNNATIHETLAVGAAKVAQNFTWDTIAEKTAVFLGSL